MSHHTHPDPAVRALIAEAEKRGAIKALDAVIARADRGIEFGPRNFLLVRRIVRDVWIEVTA